MATRTAATHGLRIFDGRPGDRTDPQRPAARGVGPDAPTARAGGGFPAALWRLGHERTPLELRVWRDWPKGIPDAVRHPSGIWVALRAL